LREFQARLVERIRDASTAAVTHPRLALRCGDLNLLLDLSSSGEILSIPPITPVPRTLDWYLGLANVRGSLMGVVDLCKFLGMRATPLDATSRVVLLSPALGVNAGILATRVLGLRNVDDLAAGSPDEAAAFGAFATGVYKDNAGTSWTEVSLEMLVQMDTFLQIGAG
jgi:twitching motility protein PilI